MIQRRMIRWVVHRLGEAGVNMDHIGVLFVGDPAQILPIGDAPVWRPPAALGRRQRVQ